MGKQVKASNNKAAQTTKNGTEAMSSEDLAIALNGQYQTLMQCNHNIQNINSELDKRKAKLVTND